MQSPLQVVDSPGYASEDNGIPTMNAELKYAI